MNATTGCKAADSHITKDALGRCYKGDPMAGGHSSRDAGQPFQIFSDYHVGIMQKYFEGASDRSGRIFYDEAAPAGAFPFVRWDPRVGAFVRLSRSSSSIRYRMVSRGVPVVKIIAPASCIELACRPSADAQCPLPC